MYEVLESVFELIVRYGILILEIIGVVIILISAIMALLGMLKGRTGFRLEMAEGISTALGFLLGGEALKTIIAPDWHEIGMTAAILLMRASMSVLIHWETTNEKREVEAHASTTGGARIGK